MSPEVRKAIESARTVASASSGSAARHRSFEGTRAVVYAVAQELPGEMTLAELCDEICIGAVQGRWEGES